MFEDAEGDLYEFAHGGTGGAHLGFAGGDQALIKGAHVWIVAGGGEGGQEQAGAPAAVAVLGQPRALEDTGAGRVLHRDQAEEGGGLFGVAEVLGAKQGEELGGELGTDARDGFQVPALLFKFGMVVDMLVDLKA